MRAANDLVERIKRLGVEEANRIDSDGSLARRTKYYKSKIGLLMLRPKIKPLDRGLDT